MWWVPAGSLPTTDDAKRKLEFIEVFGSSPYAFTMGKSPPPLVLDHVAYDDARMQEFGHDLHDVPGPLGTHRLGGVVIAELDDIPVACGSYRMLDDRTAEVMRMFVAQSARGIRVGAAIIAELEVAAQANGLLRLLLETWPRQVPALQQLGFGVCPPWSEPTLSAESVFLEKTLSAQPRRLA